MGIAVTVTRLLVFLGIWIALVLAGRGSAQEAEQASGVQVDSNERDAEADELPCVFVGPRPASDADDPAAVHREQLAELQLLVDVDRDFAEAERGLALLRLRAMGPPAFEGQEEIVVLATQRLAEVQLARKAPGRARETLAELLERRPAEQFEEDEWFEPASKEWIAREAAWLADPRLEGLRKLVAQQIAQQESDPGPRAGADATTAVDPEEARRRNAQELVDAVWRDLQEGEAELVKALGTAAVPALKTLAVMTRDGSYASQVAKLERDPLYWLVETEPETAIEVVLEGLANSPLTWRKRVARAMDEVNVFVRDRSRDEEGVPGALSDRRWLDVLGTLVDDPSLWSDVAELLQWQASYADWSEEIVTAVRHRLTESPGAEIWPWRGNRLRDRGDEVERLRSTRLLQELLDSPSDALATRAAGTLSGWGLPTAFLGRLESAPAGVLRSFLVASKRAGQDLFASERFDEWLDAATRLLKHENDEVRLEAAELLASTQLREHVPAERLAPLVDDESEAVRLEFFDRLGTSRHDLAPLSDQEFHLLRAMLDDPSAQVREKVVITEARQDRPTRFTRDELLDLARDPAPRVRMHTAEFDFEDPDVQAGVLALLAGDEDKYVIRAVEYKLSRALQDHPGRAEVLLPVLEARLANEAHPWLKSNDRLPSGVVHRFLAVTDLDALAVIVRHLRTHSDARGADAAARWLENRQRQGISALAAELASWPAEDLLFLLRAAGELEPEGRNATESREPKLEIAKLVEALLEHTEPSVAAALRALCEDAGANRILRLYAFAWRAMHEAVASADALLAFLEAPLWDDDPWNYGEVRRAAEVLGASIDAEHRNAICLRVVESDGVPERLAELVTGAYFPAREGGIALSRAMLGRWLTLDTTYCRAQRALAHLGPVPGEVEPDLLRHALRVRNVDGIALSVLAQRKDPRFLPDLRACLDPSWIGYADERHAFAKDAAFAISQYMTDAAAEVLLEGLRTVETEEIRQACFDALERIRLYQEAQERLNRRAVGKEKRDAAVRELAAMLGGDDPTTVAAAAKGLAALGAVDELPALIRLMQHDDPAVRAAAAEAVERLTAPDPEPREGAPDEPR